MRHDEIVEELSRLSETTAHLKNQLDKPKSKLDAFKEYAGIVSLLLSLATGFFAIYTAFFAEPAKSRAEAQAKLHELLAQIVTLDQEYMREVQQGDPNANNGALESKRNILLQQAEDLAGRGGVATAEDQLNLGNSYMFGSRYEPALVHFKAALTAIGSDPLTVANAETQIGRLELGGISGSTPQQGRQAFDNAEKLLSKTDSRQGRIYLMQSITTRSLAECSVGDPALGQQARLRAQEKLTALSHDPAVSPQLIDTYRTGLATSFSNTHCTDPIPASTSISSTGSSLPAMTPHTSTSANKIDLSNQMMGLLVARDYAGLEEHMTATVQSQVPETRLKSIWEQISAVTGPYKQTLSTKTTVVNSATYYIVHAQCEKALVNLALAFDGSNQISFILLTPLSALPKKEIERQATAVTSEFFQQNFTAVLSKFDQTLRAQLPEDRLRTSFSQATNMLGSFDHVVGGLKNSDLDFVDVLCQMQGGKAIVRVAYDPDMKINTFVITPGKGS